MEWMNIAAPYRWMTTSAFDSGAPGSYAYSIETSDYPVLHNVTGWSPAPAHNTVSPWVRAVNGMGFEPSVWHIAPGALNDENYLRMSLKTNRLWAIAEYGSVGNREFSRGSILRGKSALNPAGSPNLVSTRLTASFGPANNYSPAENLWPNPDHKYPRDSVTFNKVAPGWAVIIDGIDFQPTNAWRTFPKPLVDGNHRWMAVESNQLGAVGEYGSVLRDQLSSLQRVISRSNSWLASELLEPEPERDWGRQYYDFRNDLAASGVLLNIERLRITERLFDLDAEIAVKVLAVFSEGIAVDCKARIKRTLQVFSKAKRFLGRALRRAYQLGNLISSQRRWYLHHGSHPSGYFPLAA